MACNKHKDAGMVHCSPCNVWYCGGCGHSCPKAEAKEPRTGMWSRLLGHLARQEEGRTVTQIFLASEMREYAIRYNLKLLLKEGMVACEQGNRPLHQPDLWSITSHGREWLAESREGAGR